MRVAIIGKGIIGQTLAKKLDAAGMEVIFGVRSAPAAENERPIAAAVAGADAVIVAIPGGAVAEFVEANADALLGRLIVDASNNVGAPAMNSAAAIARFAPTARYARAFNTLGWENFEDPSFGDEIADLFFAASDEDRATVEEIITAVGLRPVCLGGAEAVPLVASLVGLWFKLMQLRGNRQIAFRMLER